MSSDGGAPGDPATSVDVAVVVPVVEALGSFLKFGSTFRVVLMASNCSARMVEQIDEIDSNAR